MTTRLAQLTLRDGGYAVAINPAHIVSVVENPSKTATIKLDCGSGAHVIGVAESFDQVIRAIDNLAAVSQ